jgi:hypothetical protein
MKKYKVEISDKTGHTEVADLTADQAAQTVAEKVKANAYWVYVNGAPFEFEGGAVDSELNIQKLKSAFEAQDDPNIVLAGTLIGG